ncbi:hypothetical protein ACWC9S_08160 [Streptomyces xiamenensis]
MPTLYELALVTSKTPRVALRSDDGPAITALLEQVMTAIDNPEISIQLRSTTFDLSNNDRIYQIGDHNVVTTTA